MSQSRNQVARPTNTPRSPRLTCRAKREDGRLMPVTASTALVATVQRLEEVANRLIPLVSRLSRVCPVHGCTCGAADPNRNAAADGAEREPTHEDLIAQLRFTAASAAKLARTRASVA